MFRKGPGRADTSNFKLFHGGMDVNYSNLKIQNIRFSNLELSVISIYEKLSHFLATTSF